MHFSARSAMSWHALTLYSGQKIAIALCQKTNVVKAKKKTTFLLFVSFTFLGGNIRMKRLYHICFENVRFHYVTWLTPVLV